MSVVIPAFNSGAHVGEAIESVLAQEYRPVEVVVVDDGSTDDTRRAVERFGAAVTYLYQENAGAGHARNRGVRASRGELIAFLDADDLWLPGKLEAQVERYLVEPEVGIVTCGAEAFRDGRTTRVDLGRKRDRLFRDGNVARALLLRSGMSTPTVLMPRHVFEDVGGFDEELRIGEDDNLWIRVAARHPVVMVDRVLVRVRKTGKSLTSDVELLLEDVQRSLDKLESDPVVRAQVGSAFDRKRAGLCWALGYRRFEQGDLRGARAAFGRALRLSPSFLNAWLFLVVSCLPRPVVRFVRRAKRWLSRAKP